MKPEVFKEKLGEEWTRLFTPFLQSKECDEIYSKLRQDSKKTIFPSSNNTFRAFRECELNNLKLLIISMEPYSGVHYLKGTKDVVEQASGLALDCSTSPYDKLQPSLVSFLEGFSKYYELDYEEYYKTKDLSYLEKQGVLLGNRSLTVVKGQITSHIGVWDSFWAYFIQNILPSKIPILFLGKDSVFLKRYVFELANPVFYLDHPSFAARSGQDWELKNVPNQINNYLREHHQMAIKWSHKSYEEQKEHPLMCDHFLPF